MQSCYIVTTIKQSDNYIFGYKKKYGLHGNTKAKSISGQKQDCVSARLQRHFGG